MKFRIFYKPEFLPKIGLFKKSRKTTLPEHDFESFSQNRTIGPRTFRFGRFPTGVRISGFSVNLSGGGGYPGRPAAGSDSVSRDDGCDSTAEHSVPPRGVVRAIFGARHEGVDFSAPTDGLGDPGGSLRF